jgi:hypothetical protein
VELKKQKADSWLGQDIKSMQALLFSVRTAMLRGLLHQTEML